MFYTLFRLFLSQQGCDLEDSRSELAPYEHDAKRQQEISRFDSSGGGHFLEFLFQDGRLPGGDEGKLAEEFCKKGLFGSGPLGLDGCYVNIGRGWWDEKERGLLHEIGQQRSEEH